MRLYKTLMIEVMMGSQTILDDCNSDGLIDDTGDCGGDGAIDNTGDCNRDGVINDTGDCSGK